MNKPGGAGGSYRIHRNSTYGQPNGICEIISTLSILQGDVLNTVLHVFTMRRLENDHTARSILAECPSGESNPDTSIFASDYDDFQYMETVSDGGTATPRREPSSRALVTVQVLEGTTGVSVADAG